MRPLAFIRHTLILAAGLSLLLVAQVYAQAPTIDSFSPTAAGEGQTVTITGTNLTGVTLVDFGGTIAASFTVQSSTTITAVLGAGGSGGVYVYAPAGGNDYEPGFSFLIPPASLYGDLIAATAFRANWNVVTGATSYYIDVSTSNTFSDFVPGLQNASVGNVTSHNITGLTAGTIYYFRVRSYDNGPLTPNSPTANIITLPPAPVSLPPTNVTFAFFTANWQAAPTATGYVLDIFVTYPQGSGGGPPFIQQTLGNVLSYNVPSFSVPGCEVVYKVKATTVNGESPYSNTQSFQLLPHWPAPGYPMPCSYPVGQTSFTASWGFDPSSGATGILVDVALDGNFAQPIPGSPFVSPFVSPVTISSLQPGTSYVVRYANHNAGGATDWGAPPFVVTTLPESPVIGSSSSTTNSVTINWAAVPGATGYYLDLSKDNFTNFVVGYSNLLVSGVTTYTVSSLDPLTNYQARIRAKGECGSTANSNVVTISTLAIEPVTQPTALNFSNKSSTGLTGSFTNASSAPAGYLVLYKAGSSPTELPVDGASYTAGNTIGTSTVVHVGSANTFNLTGLTPETQYFFDVFSFNGASGFNYLAAVPLEGSTVTHSSEPVSQPTSLSFSELSDTSLKISFTAALGSPTGYLVLTKVGSASTEVPVDGVGYTTGSVLGTSKVVYAGANTTITDSGLTAGTTYFYSIFSFNGTTNTYNYLTTSPLQGSQVTSPAVPTLGTPTSVSQTGFQLTWAAVAGATDYALDVSTDDFNTFVTGYSAKLLGNVTIASVTGLSAGSNYKARIRAVNAAGASANSSAQPALTIPSNPVLGVATAITGSSFTVNWTAVPGASGYQLDISIDDFNNFVAGYNALIVSGTSYTATSLNPSTTFKIRLRAANTSGPSGNSSTISATTSGLSPTSPLAVGNLTFAGKQDANTTQTLNISVSGGTAPYTVQFKHKGILATAFTTVPLTASTPGNYLFAIIPSMLDKMGVEFEAVAADATGATDKKVGKIFTGFSEAQSPAIPIETFGGTIETWSLFSIPYEIDNKSISTIFSGYDPDRHEYDWRIMRYRTSSNDYVNFNTGQVKLGEAYWFNAKEPAVLKVGVGQTTTQVPFPMTLVAGWNLIGNPYTINISWNKVLTDNPTVSGVESLQIFNGSVQATGDVLAPFRGGFVWSDANTTVNINPVTAASGGRTTAAKPKIESEDVDAGEWMLPLRLSSNGTESELGGFGMHPQAVELKDNYDAMTVPRFMRFCDLVSQRPGYFYSRFSTDVVSSQATYTWTFTLASNHATGVSHLVWDQQALQSSYASLYLYDKSTGHVIDMKSQGTYAVDLTRGDFRFDVFYSSAGEPFRPKEVLLGNAWPNPASSFVNIPVALPERTTDIDLTVYDLTGRPVVTVARGTFEPGAHTFRWDVSGDVRKDSGGLFIYRLSFLDNAHPPIQKKLIIR